jgi:hypothetical protein
MHLGLEHVGTLCGELLAIVETAPVINRITLW